MSWLVLAKSGPEHICYKQEVRHYRDGFGSGAETACCGVPAVEEPVYARVADDADDAGQGYAAYTYMTRIRAEDFIGLNYKFDLLWGAMGAWNDESKLCPITLSRSRLHSTTKRAVGISASVPCWTTASPPQSPARTKTDPLQWHPAAGGDEMDRSLRLQVDEALY